MSEPKYHKDSSITAEANRLVYGDRGKAYSHPLDDYKITAGLWTNILRAAGVLAEDKEISPYHAALCMVGVKLSRASRNIGHHDSLVDGAGYFEVAHEINAAEKDMLDKAADCVVVPGVVAAQESLTLKLGGWARFFIPGDCQKFCWSKPFCIRAIDSDGWVQFYDSPRVLYNPKYLSPCAAPLDACDA